MRILLVRSNPTAVVNTRLPRSLSREVGLVPPLGLASIAAFLRSKGHGDVFILDNEAEALSPGDVRRRIADLKPDMVGVSSMTPTFHDDLAVIKIAKEYGSRTLMGGPHLNAMPLETMVHGEIDFGIQGEGEYPVLKLVEALEGGEDLRGVPGIVFRNRDGSLFCNSPYIHKDLEELPVPARDLLPNDKYFSVITNGRLTTICPGRGCPFRCGYCFKQPSDRKVRFRQVKSVVDEVESVVDELGVREIDFVTDTFTVKRPFIEGFCKEMLDRDIKVSWTAPTRVDCVSPDLLKLMKKAGCRSLRYGIESGSDKILKLMQKKADKERMVEAFQWTKQAGIEAFAYFIIGYIGETEETIRETLDFVDVLRPDRLMYNIATPLPETLLFSQAAEAGLIPRDYWVRFVSDPSTERIPFLFPESQKWIKKAYYRFFFSPRVILKEFLKIRLDNIYNYGRALRGLLRLWAD